jgi:hypothetical protein
MYGNRRGRSTARHIASRLDQVRGDGQNYVHYGTAMTLYADLRAQGCAASKGDRRQIRQPDPQDDGGAVAVRARRRIEEPQAVRQPAPFQAQWEIRFGPDNRFRVLYNIDRQQRAVQILAVGEKVGNRLIVGGEEVEL